MKSRAVFDLFFLFTETIKIIGGENINKFILFDSLKIPIRLHTIFIFHIWK